jgi:hypothetical protein
MSAREIIILVIQLVRKNVGGNEHEILLKFVLRRKLQTGNSAFIAVLHSKSLYGRIFHNKHNSYPPKLWSQ